MLMDFTFQLCVCALVLVVAVVQNGKRATSAIGWFTNRAYISYVVNMKLNSFWDENGTETWRAGTRSDLIGNVMNKPLRI